MDKDKALKVAVKMLAKIMSSDNADEDTIKSQAFLLTAEAENDYASI